MKKLFFALLLFSTITFAQVKVTTLSGTTSAAIYPTNNYYNNGPGNVSTFNMPLGVAVNSQGVVYAFDDYVPVIRKIMPDGTTSKFCGEAVFVSPSWVTGFVDGSSPKFTNITAIATDNQDNVYVMDHNRLRKITSNGVASTITTNQIDFKNPEGIVVDAYGNIYVSNTDGRNIKKVTPQGIISIFATGFSSPKGIAIDSNGNLLVADNFEVKKVTPSAAVTTFAIGFNVASGIVVDVFGNVYVSDSFNNVVKKFTATGLLKETIGSGSPSFRDTSTLFFWRLPAFYNPLGLAIDSAGNLYVADKYNQRIRKVTNQ